MKKEVFLAVMVGFALGLLITFGIWTANKSLSPDNPQPTPVPISADTPAPEISNDLILSITSPENESLFTVSSVTITGKTLPNLPVSVLSEKSQVILSSDSKGEFSQKLELEGGFNRIKIIVTNSEGKTASKELLLTYTTSKI